MSRHWWLLLGCVLTACACDPTRAMGVAMPRQGLARMTPAQWNGLYAAAAGLPLAQRVAYWADLAGVEATYVADPLGEGPANLPDTDPLSDFSRVDCVTYVEQVYALALARSYGEFPTMLQRIRYRDAQIAYRWRNHYLVSDWLPANSWCIRECTEEIAPGLLVPMTKTIARGAFFAGKGLAEYAALSPEDQTISYLPRDRVAEVAGKLRTGDLIIFVISTPGIIAGHAGLVRMVNGQAYLQHASQTAGTVITVPLGNYLRTAPARFLGVMIARPFQPAGG